MGFNPALSEEIFACFLPAMNSTGRLCRLNFTVVRAFARAAYVILEAQGIDLIVEFVRVAKVVEQAGAAIENSEMPAE